MIDRRHTFSVRLFLALSSSAILLPLLGVAALVLFAGAHLQQRAVEDRLQVRARTLAAVTELNVRHLLTDINVLRGAPIAEPHQQQRFQAAAERYLVAHPDWRAVALLDVVGQNVVAAGAEAVGLVQAFREANPSAFGAPNPIVATFLFAGQPLIGCTAPTAAPTAQGGRLLILLSASDFLPDLAEHQPIVETTIGVLDQQHRVLASNKPDLVGVMWPYASTRTLTPFSTTARTLLGGQPAYGVMIHLESVPWDFAMVVPATMVEEPVRLSRRLALALAVLLVVPVLLSITLGGWLGTRIRGLADLANAVAHESALPDETPSRVNEIDTVQAALLQAGHLVRQRRAETERVRAIETHLTRLHRLETVGHLAAAVAHDFGNHLFIIRGQLEQLAEAASDQPALLRLITPAVVVAGKSMQLVQQLSTLATEHAGGAKAINANAVLQELTELLRHLAGRNITVEMDLSDGLWDCWFDPNRLQSTVVNLVTNARDAMPNGGAILIATRNFEVADAPGVLPDEPGLQRYVSLTVTDDGIGMPPEILSHVFEPFFTTKPAGYGTGIGLSVLAATVRAAGGYVLVTTEVGVGTRFTIMLPEASAVLSDHAKAVTEADGR